MDEESLFRRALGKSQEDRSRFLEEECGDDETVRSRIEQRIRDREETIVPDGTGSAPDASNPGDASSDSSVDDASPEDCGTSVLTSLGNTWDVPNVALRDSGESSPVLNAQSTEIPQHSPSDRYQLHGEIARGGMGAIIKGRDIDLGRDLAIKVLLDAHRHKPEVIQRFVEEAQIGGQLQHPGIAPVYELGQFDDQRPFFSMKLVKGKTLSKLLSDRKEVAEDLGRMIGIFEQICQTMAYAHSRGVIHRDLKPANIMVGAFGEVQVMDWGLAKVLSEGGVADERKSLQRPQGQSVIETVRSVGSSGPGSTGSTGSQTQMGSVVGTPAYMPPEQALGEIDQMDERSDVFGLGAILCEILTGQPPYVAEGPQKKFSGARIIRLASRAKLDGCLSRLDECGADEDLVALAKSCLKPDPYDRPRDSGELASQVTAHLESVQTKLREAEMERAAQAARAEAESLKAIAESERAEAESARAQEESKRRRVTLALAASLLLLGAVGGGGWLFLERNEARRLADEATRQATHAAQMELLAEQRDLQRKSAEDAKQDAQAATEEFKKSLYDSILSDARASRLLRRGGYRDHVLQRLDEARQLDIPGQNPARLRQEAIACLGDYIGKSPTIKTDLGFYVRNLAIAPGAREHAVATGHGRLLILDAQTAEELQSFQFQPGVSWVEYSPNGQELIAACLSSNTLIILQRNGQGLWEERNTVSCNGESERFAVHNGRVAFDAGNNRIEVKRLSDGSVIQSIDVGAMPFGIGFIQEGSQLVSYATHLEHSSLALWDIESGALLAEKRVTPVNAYCMTISPDESYLGLGRDSGMVFFDLPSFESRLDVQVEPVLDITISSDSQFAAITTRQRRILLWSLNSRREVASVRTADTRSAATVKFGARSLVVATGRTIQSWDLTAAKERTVLGGHKGGISGLVYSPDGKVLASCAKDHTVKLWDTETGDLLRTIADFSSPAQTASFHPTEPVLVTGEYRSGTVSFHDWKTGQLITTLETNNVQHWEVAFSPDGRYVGAVGVEGLTLWEVTYDPSAAIRDRLEFRLIGKRSTVGLVLLFSPDSRFLAFGDRHMIRVWDLSTGHELTLTAPEVIDPINSLHFLHDSRTLAFVGADGGLQGWDVLKNQRVFRIGAAGDFAQGYSAVTSNARLFATVKPPGRVSIWDIENGKQWFDLPESTAGVWDMSWDPAGESLAISRSDGSLSIWHVPEIRAALDKIELDWDFEQPRPADDSLQMSSLHSEPPSADELAAWQLSVTRRLLQRRSLRTREQLTDAIDVMTREAERSPTDTNVRLELGWALRDAGRTGEAEETFQEALKLVPDNASMLNHLVWNLVSVPDIDGNFPMSAQALQWARRANELEPNNASYVNTIGIAYLRDGQWQEAVQAMKRAIGLGGDSPYNWLFLTIAESHLDNKEEATRWYDKSLEWRTDNEPNQELEAFFSEAENAVNAEP